MREEDQDNPLDLNNLPEDSTCRDAGKQILDDNFTSGCSSNVSSSNASSRRKEKGLSSRSSAGGGGEGELADENDNKVYECRFCSLKFCKSQALGGHMNRHRQERETETLNKARQLVYGNDNLAAFATPTLPHSHSHPHLGPHHIPLGGGSVINHHQGMGLGAASTPHIYPTSRIYHPPPPPHPTPPSSSPTFLHPRPTITPPPSQPPYLYNTTQSHRPLTSSYPHTSYSPPPTHHHSHHTNSTHHDNYFVGHMTTHHIPSTTAHPPGSTNNDNHHHRHQSSSYTCFGAPVGLGTLPSPPGGMLNRGGVLGEDVTFHGQQENGSNAGSWIPRQHLDSAMKARFQDGI